MNQTIIKKCGADSLNREQEEALFHILRSMFYWKEKSFVLSGVSGSGKTHLINVVNNILKFLKIETSVTALTGKAVMNLKERQIKCSNIGTMHSLFMELNYDETKEEFYFDFINKKKFQATFRNSVIIIDEASMIPQNILEWLLENDNIYILFVGDKEQLGPVDNSGFVNVLDFYDYHIEKIERTDNEIVNLSKNIRQNGTISNRFSNSPHISIYPQKQPGFGFLEKYCDYYDIIICGTNRLREIINDQIREVKGHESDMPEVGETIICKRNNIEEKKERLIYNGELFKVVGCDSVNGLSYKYRLQSLSTPSVDDYVVTLNPRTWNQKEEFIKSKNKTRNYKFDWGYTITCHQSQGSEWNNVLFIDEDVSYFLEQKRFRYTGITRAKEHITIFRQK